MQAGTPVPAGSCWSTGSYVNLNGAPDGPGRPIYVTFTQQLRSVLIVLDYNH